MENNRRSFLKRLAGGAAATVALTVLPGPLKAIATRLGLPASSVVRIMGLSHSTRALRATWPAVAAVTARIAQARTWVVATGVAASAALKAFMGRHKFLPQWYDPRFSPSLRGIDGRVR